MQEIKRESKYQKFGSYKGALVAYSLDCITGPLLSSPLIIMSPSGKHHSDKSRQPHVSRVTREDVKRVHASCNVSQ
jgi:hypothetical protein